MRKGMVLVRPGDVHVAGAGAVLATLGLGSCVAVAVHDPERPLGGMCHAMLPDPIPGRPNAPAGRFASLVVPALVDALLAAGAEASRLRAWIVGGATMFPMFASEGDAIGGRNVRAARSALERLGVPVVSEDVGGTWGRSVYFAVDHGSVEVKSVQDRRSLA